MGEAWGGCPIPGVGNNNKEQCCFFFVLDHILFVLSQVCKSLNSMGGICIILRALFTLVLFFHISLEALIKPK